MTDPRRGVHEAASASHEDFHRELGRVYVDEASAHTSHAILDDTRRRTLTAWVEVLVPGNEHWPSAADTDSVGYIDATVFAAPALRPILLRGLDQLEALVRKRHRPSATFADLLPEDRIRLLGELELLNPGRVFELILELTFEAYYRDTRVLEALERRTGFSMERAMHGWDMEPFDTSTLDRVKTLPPRYRRPGP